MAFFPRGKSGVKVGAVPQIDHIPPPAPVHRKQGLVVQCSRSFFRTHEAGQDLKQSGLTAAVAPEEQDRLSRAEGKGYIPQDRAQMEGFGDIFRSEER